MLNASKGQSGKQHWTNVVEVRAVTLVLCRIVHTMCWAIEASVVAKLLPMDLLRVKDNDTPMETDTSRAATTNW